MNLSYCACSKIGDSTIIAPVATTSPPQRLVLGAPDLACSWIDVALEFGRCAAKQASADLIVVVVGAVVPSGPRGVSGGSGWLKGRRDGGGALQALELGLLVGGELGRSWALGEA